MFKNGGRYVEWQIYKNGNYVFTESAWGTEDYIKQARKQVKRIYKGCEMVEKWKGKRKCTRL